MKKIIILGSTGSIGKSLLKIISKKPNFYKVQLLTANKNYLELFSKQKNLRLKMLY